MIENIRGNLAALGLDKSRLDLSSAQSAPGLSFAQVMAAQTGSPAGSSDAGEVSPDKGRITQNPYTGFFQELQEERMKELREEILEEMGLTEEKLAQMDPEARANVEKIIAKKIQIRLMAQSAMDEDDPAQKEMLMANVDMMSL